MMMARSAGLASNGLKRGSTRLSMSTDEADEMGEESGGGEPMDVEPVAAEPDVKKDLLDQIDLATSSKKRCATLP